MQYNIPQFVDVEDKIIGPLTLKQFLTLLGGGLLVFLFWSMFKVSLYFFAATLPTAFVFMMLAFGKFNGRPVLGSIAGLVKFFFTPRYRVFIRGAADAIEVKKRVIEREQPAAQQSKDQTNRMSRLKSLAYLLDQKAAEEERLIHSGGIGKQWLDKL
ncbi:MAG: PrgI family protein [Candidatus Doudnabacteria bacterium]|nr:PrgI family protein [bacterium]MDZ4243626.1 PrgI family protein [Candidatus Doudnabacteria bacterium]